MDTRDSDLGDDSMVSEEDYRQKYQVATEVFPIYYNRCKF
jgi:hypothetical protein